MFQAFESMETGGRLRGNAFYVRHVMTEAAGGPYESAAGAHAGDKVRKRAFGLLHQLNGGGFVVRFPISRIIILIRIEIQLGIFSVEALALADCAVGTLSRIGENHFGSVCLQHAFTLD